MPSRDWQRRQAKKAHYQEKKTDIYRKAFAVNLSVRRQLLVEPDSIMVDPKSVTEINRLRRSFRPDLPAHTFLPYSRKRKLMAICHVADAPKKRKSDPGIVKRKSRKIQLDDDQHKVVPQSKKTEAGTSGSGVLALTINLFPKKTM